MHAHQTDPKHFVHYREQFQKWPLSKKHLAHWLGEAIIPVYAAAGMESPLGI